MKNIIDIIKKYPNKIFFSILSIGMIIYNYVSGEHSVEVYTCFVVLLMIAALVDESDFDWRYR